MAGSRIGTGALALFVIFACLCMAGGSASGTAATPGFSAIFTDIPADVAVRTPLWGEERPPPCSFFAIRVLPAAAPIVLATSGLGPARLAAAPDGGCPPPQDRRWAAEIRVAASGAPQRIALRLLPQGDRDAERTGRIVAIGQSGELGAANLVVRSVPTLSLWPELKWFFGFVVPAFLTFLLGRYTVARAERRKEHADLVVFRTVHKDKVDALIDDAADAAADREYERPGLQILQTLRAQGIIASLPNRDKERLVGLCEKDDVVPAVKLLARLFPLHAGTVKQALRKRDSTIQGG